MSESAHPPRKRKLPPSLNLRPQSATLTSPRVTGNARFSSKANSNKTRNTNATANTASTSSSSSNADFDPNKRARLSVSDKSPNARSSTTSNHLPRSSARLTSDLSASSNPAAVSSPRPATATLQFTSGLPNPNLLFPLSAPLTSRPLPIPFVELPPQTVFPLLSLPSDILTEITSFLWIWDAFFLRCTCQSLRAVSGLSGGVTGRPVVKQRLQNQQLPQKKLNFPPPDASTLSRRVSSSLVNNNESSAVAAESSSPSPVPLSRWSSSSTTYPPLSITQSIDSASQLSVDRTPSLPLAAATTIAPGTKTLSAAPVNSASVDDSAASLDYDEHRFWHNWNSLDLKTILLGWKEFEARRAELVKALSSLHSSSDVQVVASSPRDSPPATSTIMIFDSDEDADARSDVGEPDDEEMEQDLSPGNIQMKGDHRNAIDRRRSIFTSSGAHATASPSSNVAMVLSRNSIYDKLHHVAFNVLQGSPRFKTSAPFTSTTISTPRGIEDIASSSEEDLWLMNFLQTYRFPNISHLHLGYLTLHSSLLQHLQVFCCQVESGSSPSAVAAASSSGGLDDDPPPAASSSSAASTRSRGIVTEVSAQHSEKSVGKWLNTLVRGMGRLTILHLDATHSTKPLWNSLAPLMPSLSQLTRLHLIGPTTLTTALPATILDSLSSSLPLLSECTIEHGWLVNQSALVASASKIKAENRWMVLQKLRLIDFRQIEHIFPLFQAFHGRTSLTELTIQSCVNMRLPIVEMPKKVEMASASTASTTSIAKKPLKRATTPPRKGVVSPPSAAPAAPAIMVSPHTGELTVQMSSMPCVPHLTYCDFSACSSLTVPSFHAISVAFPRLQVLHLNGYDSKTIGGSAIKLLFDPTLFPSLCELHLMNAIHMNDHALEALPKKTRMNHLDTLNITIDTNLLSNTVAWIQSAHTTASNASANGKSGGTQLQRLTEQGLRMLCVYCPALTSLSLAGHSHLSVPAMLRMPSHLLYLQDYNVCGNKFVDASFLHGILHNNVRHALTLRVSLTNALMRTASIFLQHSHSSLQPDARNPNSAASSSAPRSFKGSHVAISSSPSSAPSIYRVRLSQMLAERMSLLSKNRITLVVQA